MILWVDGNDPAWQLERDKYCETDKISDNRDFRFRDWNNLQYLFRGIENFAPWVRKVHFVTCGHLPKWMNTECSKLNIVKHEDFIPKRFLPTFNSEAIEIFLHKIPNLAEHFVYFNDDMFILRKMKEKDFFRDGLPCDSALLNAHCCELENGGTLCDFLNIGIINRHFDMKKVMLENWRKWYNLIYGYNVLRNLYLLPCPRFPGMMMQHLPGSYLKSVYKEVWNVEGEILENTANNRFRSLDDVNQWLFKEWQIVTGKFAPRGCRIGTSLLSRDTKLACKIIKKQKYKLLSYNDEKMSEEEFYKCKEAIINSFETILPEKSEFEK